MRKIAYVILPHRQECNSICHGFTSAYEECALPGDFGKAKMSALQVFNGLHFRLHGCYGRQGRRVIGARNGEVEAVSVSNQIELKVTGELFQGHISRLRPPCEILGAVTRNVASFTVVASAPTKTVYWLLR